MTTVTRLADLARHTPEAGDAVQASRTRRARVVGLRDDGVVLVVFADQGAGAEIECEVLHASGAPLELAVGDRVLVLDAQGGEPAVVLGRIGRYAPPQVRPQVTIEATETLTLKCGEASVDLRADGKVMVRGEDVLLRAKGTQRIRAGNVAIN